MVRIAAAGIVICVLSMLSTASTDGRQARGTSSEPVRESPHLSQTEGKRSDPLGSFALSTSLSVRPHLLSIAIEASGRVRIDGRSITLHELLQTVREHVTKDASVRVQIVAEPDVSQGRISALLEQLAETGVRPDAVAVRPGAAPATRPHDPKKTGALLRQLLPTTRTAAGAIATDETRFTREVEARGDVIRWRLEAIERLVADWFETRTASSRPVGPAPAHK